MRPEDSSDSIDRLAYFAIGASVLLITWNGFRLGGGALVNAFLVLAFGLVALRTVVRRTPVPLPPWMVAAGIGFALAALLNLIFPADRTIMDQTLVHYRTIPHVGQPVFLTNRSDMLALFQFEVGLIVLPVLIASVANTARRVERLVDAFVLGAAINAGVGLVDWAGFRISPIYGGLGRTAGLTVHPNYLALTCTIAIPLALVWIVRGGRWRTAGYGCTGLLLAGAYASGSRVGAVTAVLGVIATVVVIPRLRTGLGFTVPAVGMALVALVFFAHDQILHQIRLGNDVGTSVSTAGSDSQRSQLAHLALQQFSSHPLQGVGYQVIEDAHSIYLQLLAAGGVIAMISYLTYLAGLAGAAWRAFAGPQRDIAAAASVSIVMFLINGVLDSQLGDKYLYVIPGFLVAMSYVAAKAGARESSEQSATSGRATTGRPLVAAPVAGSAHAAG